MSPNLEISTTVGCRMVCDYCPQTIHIRKYHEGQGDRKMTLDGFKQMLSGVPKNVEIIFAGMAEPWLNSYCTAMVEHCFSEGYKVGVYSTTSGMISSDVARICVLPFMFFTLHLPDIGRRMKLKVDEEYLRILKLVVDNIPTQKMVIGEMYPEVAAITGPVADHSPGLISRGGSIKHLAIPPKAGVLECKSCGPKIDHNILLPNGDVLLCCMPAGSKILSEGVYRNIEELKVGDKVVGSSGQSRKITELLRRTVSEDLITLKTSNYFQPVSLTGNHPVLIKIRRTGEVKWVEASAIKRLDYAVMPKNLSTPKVSLPKDLMWLYGLYLAEGFITKRGNEVIFCLNRKEQLIADRIRDVVQRHYPDAKTSTYWYRASNMDVHVVSRELADFLFLHFSKYCDKKSISEYIMSARPEELMALVQGHRDGDGCDETRRCRHTTTSEQMSRQIYLIYLINGIVPSFSTSQQKDKKPYYEITVSNRKNKMIIQDESNWYFPIREISKIPYTGVVYNFEIEVDESYVSNNIVVHNCMDYAQEHVIGNLNKMPYHEIFQSAEYNRVMDGLRDENSNILCRRCEISSHA